MREALAARSDRDFVAAAPRRARTRAEPERGEGIIALAIAAALRHPREILVTLILAGAGGAITWNALALQTARHPAPLFGTRSPGEEARPAAPLRPDPLSRVIEQGPASLRPLGESAPLPPRPTGRDPAGDLSGARGPIVLPPARPAPAASIAPAAVATPRQPAAVRDPIADLIRFGEPAPIPPGFVGRAPGNIVSAGQRALARLGYGVTVDGLMGPGTRQAIEQFERDRRLPVTGELGPHTARALAAQSGIPVE